MKIRVRRGLLGFFFAAAAGNSYAAPSPSGPRDLLLWPATRHDLETYPRPETRVSVAERVAGRHWMEVDAVSRPTLTIYRPKGTNTGAAVMVFPGGGYKILAIDLEGTEICDWLTSKGITCLLLKYRVPGNDSKTKSGPYPFSAAALEDAQRAMGLARYHAHEWNFDPRRIGVIGFSAGGHLVAAISTHFAKRIYAPLDSADDVSCRPDFAMAIYPGHMTLTAAQGDARQFGRKVVIRTADRRARAALGVNPDIPFSKESPPTFLVQAQDDFVDGVRQSLVYYGALTEAGVPAEMHLFAKGGHGFGLRRTDDPITHWPELAEQWLRRIGMLSPQSTLAL